METQQLIENTKTDKDRIEYYLGKFTEIQEKQKKYQESKKNPTLYQNGSGKSTILNALKDTNPRKYINVSMMEFSDEVERNNKVVKNNQEEKIRKVEQSIIQQLIYQVPQKTIPYSKLKREYPSEKSSKFRICLLACFIVVMILFLIFRGWNFIIPFNIKPFETWTALVALLFWGISGLYLLNCFLYYIHKNYRLTKIITKTSTTIELNKYESVYNYCLDELIYFFKCTSYDIVIFEDIDRYNDIVFFSHLRELNALLNNSQYLGKPITFIYAVREDIFIKQDKHKFFDAMITIKPILSFTSSLKIFQEFFKNEKIEDKTLTILSEYMYDMRAIKNLVEEYHTYLKYPNSPAYKKDNLLSILVLKNLYPQEFSNLQQNRSVINKIFQNKLKLIEEENRENKPRIEHLTRALNDEEYCIDPKYSILGLIKDFLEEYMYKHDILNDNIKSIGIAEIFISNNFTNLMNANLDFKKIVNIQKINITYQSAYAENKTFPIRTTTIAVSDYLQEQIQSLVELHKSKKIVQSKTKAEIVQEIQALNIDTTIKTSTFYNTRLDELNLILKSYIDNNSNSIKFDNKFTKFIKTIVLNDLIDEEYG